MYEFTIMSFGLTNAPAYFMYLMNKVFMEYLNNFGVIFIDEILIYSKRGDEYEDHLKKSWESLEHIDYMLSNQCE